VQVIRIIDPMAYRKKILLGKIIKTHGFRGVVIVRTEQTFSGDIPKTESVFLEIDGRPVPFFIEWIEKAGADSIRIKFSGYDDSVKIGEFVGCRVLCTNGNSRLPSSEDISNLKGYKLVSTREGDIGIIKEIVYNPGQLLLKVRSESGKEILIPLHENLIEGIDPEQKILTMVLPEGLTEINR
jgi:16S rRNA processing protein RimM